MYNEKLYVTMKVLQNKTLSFIIKYFLKKKMYKNIRLFFKRPKNVSVHNFSF